MFPAKNTSLGPLETWYGLFRLPISKNVLNLRKRNYNKGGGAFDSAQNHKRQHRKRQSSLPPNERPIIS